MLHVRKNPFVQKRASHAKRRRVAAVIASPGSQARANVERVAQSVLDAQERQQRIEAKAKEQRARREERARAVRMAQAATTTLAAASTPSSTVATPRTRVPPKPVSKPVSKSVFSFEALATAGSAFDSPGVECIIEEVRARRDAAVLCATNNGQGVQSWNSLHGAATSEDDAESRRWMSPANWRAFVEMCSEINPDLEGDEEESRPTHDVALAAASGSYNAVVLPSSTAKLDDARRWPPQLLEAGRAGAYVVRLTKTRPFAPRSPGPDGKPCPLVFRFMQLDQVVREMAFALHAASIGMGPPVLAAVSWVETTTKTPNLQYGLLLVLERCLGDMIDFELSLREKFPPDSYVSGPSPAYANAAVAAATDVARLCYRAADDGFLNFDIKPANVLWHKGSSFYLCDFDPVHFVHVPSSVASTKAAFFVNMLLMCMHVRSHSSNAFAGAFLDAVAPCMLALWRDALRADTPFGNGAGWLAAARLPQGYDDGSFCAQELRHTTSVAERCRRHFEMMVWEYSFSTSDGRQPSKKCVAWPGWQKGPANGSFFGSDVPLVAQLLSYCFFYSKPAPSELAAALGKVVDAR